MVWFPVPDSGIFAEHSLKIHALPGEDGTVRPVTLTWLHRTDGDVSLSAAECSGNCSRIDDGWRLRDGTAELVWKGKTGSLFTVEFMSAADQGIAEILWNEEHRLTAPLNNAEMSRLSYDFTFPPSDGLPEFAAVWLLSFLVCLAGSAAAFRLLPGWNYKRFGLAAFLIFAVFRTATFLSVSQPLTFIDSESYLGMSEMPLKDILSGTPYCHEQYWYCIARPAFIPIIYKLCRQDLTAITIVQLIVSILSWGFFTLQTAALCRHDSRKKALIILTLGLGCVPNVTRWDQVIMSESLSISAALLMMGSCFLLLRPNAQNRWKPLPAVLTALTALLYAQSRDSAVWIVILMILLLLCLNRLRTERKVLFALCLVLAAICWSVMGNTGGRWQYPFENVLFNRILPDPEGERFFIESGMPTPSRIGELYGVEHMMGSELFNSDEMAPLREWIASEGLKTYIRYMLRTPSATLRMTWYAGFETEAFEQTNYIFAPAGFRRLLPDPISKFFSCNLPGVLIIGLALAGIWTAFRRPDGERYAFPLLFVLSAYILCTGVFIADEYELARHSMVILIMMKAAAWPLICMLSEDIIPEGKNRGPIRKGK